MANWLEEHGWLDLTLDQQVATTQGAERSRAWVVGYEARFHTRPVGEVVGSSSVSNMSTHGSVDSAAGRGSVSSTSTRHGGLGYCSRLGERRGVHRSASGMSFHAYAQNGVSGAGSGSGNTTSTHSIGSSRLDERSRLQRGAPGLNSRTGYLLSRTDAALTEGLAIEEERKKEEAADAEWDVEYTFTEEELMDF